jgi:hypothetical protein
MAEYHDCMTTKVVCKPIVTQYPLAGPISNAILLGNGFQHREMSSVSARRLKTSESKYSISKEAGGMTWVRTG